MLNVESICKFHGKLAATGSFFLVALGGFFASTAHTQQIPDDDSPGAALLRITEDIRYLASDELGGRQPGTPEMEVCEEYILDLYKKVGLKGPMPDGGYRQTFDVGNTRQLNRQKTTLTLKGPTGETKLELDNDFKPQFGSDKTDISGDLVFAGYGIRADELNYNEYLNMDVKGKIVVLIRMEPQQNERNSVFDGMETSRYAYLQSKVASATRAGAAGIIMVNDGVRAQDPADDVLARYDEFASAASRIPFVHMKRSRMDAILAASPVVRGNGDKLDSLNKIEAAIDASLESVSQPLAGWSASMNIESETVPVMTSNLIGVIEGEGPLAEETIIIGGHYDHLGLGSYGSRVGYGEIHNGADDNATGTAGIMELARRFAKRDKKPARRIVFICFTAEEMGLLGAAHYCRNPVFPLEKTVTMLNYDMIGWLRDKKLTTYSWDSSEAFGDALDRANERMGEDRKLNLVKPVGGFGGSDHLPFQQRKIPVMFLHTGLTRTYHTPEDDFETIDCAGAAHVIDFTEKLIDELVNLPEAPKFAANATAGRRPTAPRLGALLVDADNSVLVEKVLDDGLAKKSGFKDGDIILKIDGDDVNRRRSVTRKLLSSAGKKIVFSVKRGEEIVDVTVELPDNE